MAVPLITLKCQVQNTASVHNPPSLRTKTPFEILIQTAGDATYMSWGWAGGSRGLEHGSFPSSVYLILSLKSVGRCSLGRCLRQTSCNTWKGNVNRSMAGFITPNLAAAQLCRSWCVTAASSKLPPWGPCSLFGLGIY